MRLTYEQEQHPGAQMADRTYAPEPVLLLNEYQDIVLAMVVNEIRYKPMNMALSSLCVKYLPNLVGLITSRRPKQFLNFVNRNKKHFIKCVDSYLSNAKKPLANSGDGRVKWTPEYLQEFGYRRNKLIESGTVKHVLVFIEQWNKDYPERHIKNQKAYYDIYNRRVRGTTYDL